MRDSIRFQLLAHSCILELAIWSGLANTSFAQAGTCIGRTTVDGTERLGRDTRSVLSLEGLRLTPSLVTGFLPFPLRTGF